MNGHLLIADSKERGMRHHDIYRPLNQYYTVLRAFVDRPYFGVSAYDDEEDFWRPVHVNGAKNPLPCKDWYGRRCHREFSKKDLLLHLASEPADRQQNFRFLVNSPDTRFHLLAFDIDANDDVAAHEITSDLYHDCFVADWDLGGNVYIERSRNRKGRYIWAIIERGSAPCEFNQICNALSHVLRLRFTRDDENRFDAIKGTLHFDDRNDLDRLFATFDGNPNDENRGTLVTMPLAGAIARNSFEDEQEAFLQFCQRDKKTKRFMNAIPETHLWTLLDLYGSKEASLLRFKFEAAKKPLTEPTASPLSIDGNYLCINAPKSRTTSTCQGIRMKAISEISGKNRMRLASSLFYYSTGCYAPSPEALVAFYEAEGLSRGVNTPQKAAKRLERAAETLEDHKANPAKGIGYDKVHWLSLVRQFVTCEHRHHPLVKYRSHRTGRPLLVEDELLAAGLYVLTASCWQPNEGDRQHSCSQEGQLTMYKRLKAENLLTAGYDLKNKRVAVVSVP